MKHRRSYQASSPKSHTPYLAPQTQFPAGVFLLLLLVTSPAFADDRGERRVRKSPPSRDRTVEHAPVDTVPVEALDEGAIRLCTQVILPERGVFVVLPAPTLVDVNPPESALTEATPRYLAVWRDASTGELFIFPRPLHDELDVGQSVLNLRRDRNVLVERLTSQSVPLEGSVAGAESIIEDVTLWQPLTRQLLWQLMEREWSPSEGEEESLGTVANLCGPYPQFGEPTETPCETESRTPDEVWEEIVVAACGGGPPPPDDPPPPPPAPCSCPSDGNSCTTDACVNGVCRHKVIPCCYSTGACDDGEPCTQDDKCNNGPVNHCPTMLGGTCCGLWTVSCPQDGDNCTNDYCKPGVGCVHEPNTGPPCGNDGNPCTSDTCYQGECQSPVPLNNQPCTSDNNVCTLDKCQNGECLYTPKCQPGYTCSPITGACTLSGEPCGTSTCPSGQTCCPGGYCCLSAACANDGDPCTNDGCTLGLPWHEPKCDEGQSCCGPTGTCCDGYCNVCLDYGILFGGFIVTSPIAACLGDVITFTAYGVIDSGGLKEQCVQIPIPPASINYSYTLVPPSGQSVSRQGSVASVVADQLGVYSCNFTTYANRECSPVGSTLGPATVAVVPLTITAEVMDQDDPANAVWASLAEGTPFYGGSEASTADNVRLTVAPDPTLGPVANVVWTTEIEGGGMFNPPPTGAQATVWDLGDVLNPTPGPIKFKVQVTYANGARQCGEFESAVGVRTDNVIAVGWIDPEPITIPEIHDNASPPLWFVNPIIVNAMPPDGYVYNILECSALAYDLSVGLITVGPVGPFLTTADREYILQWMFKYGQDNFSSSFGPPPVDFVSNGRLDWAKVDAFRNDQVTHYKVMSEFQIRYARDSFGTFLTSAVRKGASVGHTKNPCGSVGGVLDVIPAQVGPATIDVHIAMDHASNIADGSPDERAVRAFDTLTARGVSSPEAWANVGVRTIFRYDGDTSGELTFTNFPTFVIYRNGRTVQVSQQSPVRGHFYGAWNVGEYPVYPFGTVGCDLGSGIIIPDCRCGDAASLPAPSAVTPEYTVP